MSVIARIYIVRHGETDWNRKRMIQGHIDTELNELGLAQAGLAAEALKDVPFAQAFTSDLKRASKTAEIILERQNNSGILVRDEALRERFMGELQGERAPSNKHAPSLETGESIVKRSIGWWNQAIVKYVTSLTTADKPCQDVLVASHGGLISTLIRTLIINKVLNFSPELKIGTCYNASVTLLEYKIIGTGKNRTVEGHVVKYADASHLQGLKLVEVNADERLG
ncbi:phosphoglycerate mutase-like protein [Hygrophoropsis aurantiaca]|uniref:Phosphoglycerate mutase-like protein n=1 Tax=Hygrophoropsis aurantiaca TaxID=72124 RepID=A0ACB8A4Y8_9AGAM|nr:phosphoglycerate mutase-like protein [Hygrophoropsis aurantiaca]